MAEYQYKCPGCRNLFVTQSRTDIPPCPICGTKGIRQFRFSVSRSMPEHFNHSVGSYVSNERQLRDALKVISAEQSERVGMEHNYEYLSASDMADASAHGVTDEGLEESYRARHDGALH